MRLTHGLIEWGFSDTRSLLWNVNCIEGLLGGLMLWLGIGIVVNGEMVTIELII